MVESSEDRNAENFHIVEPDLIDQRSRGGNRDAPEGSLGAGRPAGGPEVPGRQGATESVGGLGVPEGAGDPADAGRAETGDAGSGGESGDVEIPGGPASGTGENADLTDEDIPDDTPAEMPPGRKFGTPGITDGT